jgi:hypothetical protein
MKTIALFLCLAAFIFLYSYVLQYGFITIDPCANTPGRNFTIGYIMAAFFPFLLGLLVYYLFVYETVFCVKSCFKCVALSAAWLVLAFVLMLFNFDLICNNVSAPVPYLFEYGCYNDIEPTKLFISLLYVANAVGIGFIIYLIVKRKIKSKKQ